MPANHTLTTHRARFASLGYWRPGSPEYEQAAREFFCALLIQQITDALSKSPPFTEAQRDSIIDLLCAGALAPESADRTVSTARQVAAQRQCAFIEDPAAKSVASRRAKSLRSRIPADGEVQE